MIEFAILWLSFCSPMADERGKVQEQTHSAATERRAARAFHQRDTRLLGQIARPAGRSGKAKKVKLETFLVSTSSSSPSSARAFPSSAPSSCWRARQKTPHFRAQLETSPPGSRTEVHLRAFVAQGGFPIVYTTTLLAGEPPASRRGPTALPRLPARLPHLPQEAPRQLIYPRAGRHGDRVFIFLITFVVPRFAQLYEQLGTKLPVIQRFAGSGKNAQSYRNLCPRRAGRC